MSPAATSVRGSFLLAARVKRTAARCNRWQAIVIARTTSSKPGGAWPALRCIALQPPKSVKATSGMYSPCSSACRAAGTSPIAPSTRSCWSWSITPDSLSIQSRSACGESPCGPLPPHQARQAATSSAATRLRIGSQAYAADRQAVPSRYPQAMATAEIDTRSALARQLGLLEEEEAGARAGDVDALRRFRIATRRARAFLGDANASLRSELRWLAGRLGPARDLDALLEQLRPEVELLGEDRVAGDEIVAELERLRAVAAGVVRETVEDERYRALIAGLRTAVELEPEPEAAEPARSARRELKRLRATYDALGDTPTDHELHRVRLKAKRVRYAAERDPALEELANAARGLQNVIGVNQDAVIAEERLRAAATEATALAAGRLIERGRARRADARSAVPAAWKQLKRAANALG